MKGGSEDSSPNCELIHSVHTYLQLKGARHRRGPCRRSSEHYSGPAGAYGPGREKNKTTVTRTPSLLLIVTTRPDACWKERSKLAESTHGGAGGGLLAPGQGAWGASSCVLLRSVPLPVSVHLNEVFWPQVSKSPRGRTFSTFPLWSCVTLRPRGRRWVPAAWRPEKRLRRPSRGLACPRRRPCLQGGRGRCSNAISAWEQSLN